MSDSTDRPQKRILVIRHGAFGDMVQTSGVLRDIRENHPHAEICLLTTPPFRRLMARCPYIDRIVVDERAKQHRIGKLVALRRTLREGSFDQVYDLQNSDRTGFYRRFLLPSIPWCRSVTRNDPSISPPDAYRLQLEAAGLIARHSTHPDVTWMAADIEPVLLEAGIDRDYIALIPGCAAQHPHKRWPFYAELAQAMIEHGHSVVTAPGPDEMETAHLFPGHVLLKGTNYLDWFELAGVLKGAAYVVGNDTGPSHVAACLNRPGLALFGSHTSPERTGIKRGRFDAIQVNDLQELPMQRVLERVLADLRNSSAA